MILEPNLPLIYPVTEPGVVPNGNQEVDGDDLTLVQAVQYGNAGRVKALIQAGADVNEVDETGISLLHWAAINNRVDVAKILISWKANVDAIGGELNASPIHWALRERRLEMVALLMKSGADPNVPDCEGSTPLHIATSLNLIPVVAYLLAQSANPNSLDIQGRTPLMVACGKPYGGYDFSGGFIPRILLKFGGRQCYRDKIDGNTALHIALQNKSWGEVNILMKFNGEECLDLENLEGKTPRGVLEYLASFENSDWYSRQKAGEVLEEFNCIPTPITRRIFQALTSKKTFNSFIITVTVFIVIFLICEFITHGNVSPLIKVILGGIGLVFLKPLLGTLTIGVDSAPGISLATKFTLYTTWFVYLLPVLPIGFTVGFLAIGLGILYNLVVLFLCDPGVITPTQEEIVKGIIHLFESGEYSQRTFCPTCLIRRSLRSKHCRICDKCVARFDHHCDWVSNCVGWKNHKHFIGYLLSLVLAGIVYLAAICFYWTHFCGGFVVCNTWLILIFILVAVNIFWLGGFLIYQLYQIFWLGLLTNERINYSRYSYLWESGGDVNKRGNVWNGNGVFQNCLDFFEIDWFKGRKKLDWKRTYELGKPEERGSDGLV